MNYLYDLVPRLIVKIHKRSLEIPLDPLQALQAVLPGLPDTSSVSDPTGWGSLGEGQDGTCACGCGSDRRKGRPQSTRNILGTKADRLASQDPCGEDRRMGWMGQETLPG